MKAKIWNIIDVYLSPQNYIAIYIDIELFSHPSIVVTQDICVPAAQKQ